MASALAFRAGAGGREHETDAPQQDHRVPIPKTTQAIQEEFAGRVRLSVSWAGSDTNETSAARTSSWASRSGLALPENTPSAARYSTKNEGRPIR